MSFFVLSEGNAFTININKIFSRCITTGRRSFFTDCRWKNVGHFNNFAAKWQLIQSKWATTLQPLTSSSVIDGNDSPNAKFCAKRFFHFGPPKKLILSHNRWFFLRLANILWKQLCLLFQQIGDICSRLENP